MNKHLPLPLLLAACVFSVGCAVKTGPTVPPPQQLATGSASTAYGLGGDAQLFRNPGGHTRTVTTRSSEAQRYFDQGLNWVYGFNHDEAVRCFTRAAELDPTCAMAWWGIAYAQGPNYNDPGMNTARQQAAWDALLKALNQLDDETLAEHALIHALTLRYANPAAEDRPSPADLKAAFAEAMAQAWARNPGDADIGVLYAEALMLKHPWGLHKSDMTPARDETLTIIATLEDVLAFAPQHPGANHYYIHAVEASADKARGLPAADRLSTLVPMSGHLTHMPSHIYVQTGHWDRAVEQNLVSIQIDAHYLAQSPDQFRQRGYVAHNGHMLAFAAMMVGREEDAMAGARFVWTLPEEMFETLGRRYDNAMCAIYDVQKRFGRWDALLAEPAPPEVLKQSTAVWRACRAIAYAAKHDFENAAIEQAAYRELKEAGGINPLLAIYDAFIDGEIALQQGDWEAAIAHLEKAATFEGVLGYGEPPVYLQPIRHTLGAVYLKAGRYEDAERVYREDLDRWPGNGWSLFGLTRALEEQGKAEEAAATRAAFEAAWADADHPLDTSCECLPGL